MVALAIPGTFVHTRPVTISSQAPVEYTYVLDNDTAHVPVLIAEVLERVAETGLCNERGRMRVGVALEEALLNAIHHGNLEVSSELRQREDDSYRNLIEQRRTEFPYRARRVHVSITLSEHETVFVIRDEGPGFDPRAVADPTDEAGLARPSGRGLLLIRKFMDEVSHNDRGNQITMIKRKAA